MTLSMKKQYVVQQRRVLTRDPPWQVQFPFTCWKLWLARNDRIFSNKSRSQHSLVYSAVQAAIKFYFLAGTTKRPLDLIPQSINWQTPPYPFLKLNTDGSALDNPGLAGAGGVLRDHQGQWIAGFSMHVGIATNNIAELEAVRQGLEMAWNMGVKRLHLELDSKVVLDWLTSSNLNYPTNILPLICDCRNLLEREWEVHMHHEFREANGCADALAKRGIHLRSKMTCLQ